MNWIGVPLSLLDNLRMSLHPEQKAVLANIDAQVPVGAALYLLDVNYYGGAQRGVYERAGLIRGDVTMHHARSRGFAAAEPNCCVWSARPVDFASLGRITGLGHGLQRLQRGDNTGTRIHRFLHVRACHTRSAPRRPLRRLS